MLAECNADLSRGREIKFVEVLVKEDSVKHFPNLVLLMPPAICRYESQDDNPSEKGGKVRCVWGQCATHTATTLNTFDLAAKMS